MQPQKSRALREQMCRVWGHGWRGREVGEVSLKKWALSSELKFTRVKLHEEGGRRICVSEGPTVRNSRVSSDSRIICLACIVH